MGYGFDIESNISLLVGLTRKGTRYSLKKAMVLPGIKIDTDEKPELYSGTPLGTTYRALSNMGVKPGYPATLVPGKDVYYRFAHSSANPKLVETQVRMEADEIGGGEATILADYLNGTDFDYAPAIHIALAREEIIDHYANSLKAAGIDTGPLIPGCAALYQAYLVSGDTEFEHPVLYANVGDDATDTIIVREGQLLYARSIGLGVNDFIDRLVPEIGGSRDAVRQVLFREVDLRPSVAADNLSGDRGVSAGQEVASRLFQQIGSTIMLAKGAQKAPKMDARKIVLSGSGAAIPGLRELMMNRVRKTVELFDPLANVATDGADEQSQETARNYRPALALGLGLAVLATDPKAERATFLPGSVRARREFLNKSLFLYLAAAVVIAVVLPLYFLSRNSLGEAEEQLKTRQQGPIGRYVAASNEIPTHEKTLERAEKRTAATDIATSPGRVATQVLLEFARKRPQSVRIKSVSLETDTNNPSGDPDFKPRVVLRMTFFIESKDRAPLDVNNTLRDDVLKRLKGVTAVEPGATSSREEPPGLDVTHTVVLDIEPEGGA